MKVKLFIGCSCFLFLGISCQNENELGILDNQADSPIGEYTTIMLDKTEQEISIQNLDFSLRLFQEADRTLKGAESQFVISPLSAFWTLSMVSGGAESTTLLEFEKVLGCEEITQKALHNYNQKLLTELKKVDNLCTLGIANSIWLDKDITAKANYVEKMEDVYGVDLFSIDFFKNSSVKVINDWCSQMTDGRIQQIVNKIDPETSLLILNAMHFKGRWDMAFDERNTKKESFTNIDQSTSEMSFMRQTMTTNYIENDLFALAKFPYGNGAYNMVILLPNDGANISQCIEKLDRNLWIDFMSEKMKQTLNVKLPKFNMQSSMMDLKNILINMGLRTAFTSKADFSSISETKVMLTKVNQSISFSIDEKGTEAAAVTSIEAGGGLSGENAEIQIRDFHVNKPFVFMIMEQSTNSILFIGKVPVF